MELELSSLREKTNHNRGDTEKNELLAKREHVDGSLMNKGLDEGELPENTTAEDDETRGLLEDHSSSFRDGSDGQGKDSDDEYDGDDGLQGISESPEDLMWGLLTAINKAKYTGLLSALICGSIGYLLATYKFSGLSLAPPTTMTLEDLVRQIRLGNCCLIYFSLAAEISAPRTNGSVDGRYSSKGEISRSVVYLRALCRRG
jgi:hypothetical protein